MQMKKKLVSMVSRTGRDLQRYNFQGCRQVVGCIPYRLRSNEKPGALHGTLIDRLEFLLISSQKSPKWMFPKGGWELDETMEEAAKRETMEEAGVLGIVGEQLGMWTFKSKSQDKWHEGYMLSFLVTEELDVWPEKDVRQRTWLTASEARETCEHQWMKEAFDVFICQQMQLKRKEEDLRGPSFLDFLTVEEPTFSIVAQSVEQEDIDCHILPLKQLQRKEDECRMSRLIHFQLTHLHRKDEECRMACSFEYLMTEEPRMVAPSGEEDAIISGIATI